MQYIHDELYNSKLLIKNVLNREMNNLKLKMYNITCYENTLKKENNYSVFVVNILSDLKNDINNLKYGIQETINIITTFFSKQCIFEEIINEASILIYECDDYYDEILASYGY